jgi:hypothetical protein
MNTLDHSAGLIDGGSASNWLGASANPAGELGNAYECLGLTDPVRTAIADAAIADVRQLFDYLASNIRRYEEPSRLKRFFNRFGPPRRVDSVVVKVPDLAGFYAKAIKGPPYLIEISAGLVLRTASLCNEVAAIKFDGASAPAAPSVWEALPNGGAFYLMPQSEAGKQYARRLLLTSMLFLYGHEFSHVCFGHCDFFADHQAMSDDERCALELDADQGAGASAAASIIKSAYVMEQLGYAPKDFGAAGIMDVVRDVMMAALIQFVLFEEFTRKDSPRYLVPSIRLQHFVSKFVDYLGWSPSAPFGPLVQIAREQLNPGDVNLSFETCAGELFMTSVGSVLANAAVTPADIARAEHIENLWKRLKQKLVPLQPFGTPQYLAQYRKSQAAQTRGGSVSRT